MTIHFDTTALAHQLAADMTGFHGARNQSGQLRILAVLLFVAPAVEVEIHGAEPAVPIDDKVGADIAHPDVVEFGGDVGDVSRAAVFFGQLPFTLTTEHGHRFISREGASDQANGCLYVGGEILPDRFLCAKGDEGPLMLVALIRHTPTAGGSRLRAQGRQAKPDRRCRAQTGDYRYLLDELTTRRHVLIPGMCV